MEKRILHHNTVIQLGNGLRTLVIQLGNGSQDICPPISQIVLKNFIKISLIIKECAEGILIKLAIVLKISKSS
jgi:hypothetical protein